MFLCPPGRKKWPLSRGGRYNGGLTVYWSLTKQVTMTHLQQSIVLVFLVTVLMQRAVYIFSLVFEKVTPALKFDWIFWNVIVLGNDYRCCTHFRFAHVFCTVPKQSIVAFKASMAYLVFLMIQVRLDDCIKPYNFMFSRTQIIDLSFMTG